MPTIDLRPSLLPVRHQGRRQSCLAFATSSVHELHAAPGEHLSVEYLHFHSVARTPGKNPNAGTTFAAAAAALAEEGQPVETAWPYSSATPSPWMPPAIVGPIHKATMVQGNVGFDEILVSLDQGKATVVGLIITDAFYRPDANGIIAFVAGDIKRGGHAVLAAGYGTTPSGEEILLIRNSWGEGWGFGGYAWLPRPYVHAHLFETAFLG